MKTIKSKKSLIIKLAALFIIAAMLLPMTFACGEKPDDNASKATEDAGAAATDPPTTAEPTTPAPTDPPTTEEPTEPFVVDSSLPYWEQIESELAWYGLEGGTKILPGADEAELMKKFTGGGAKREDLDISGDGVPFSAAYSYTVAKDMTNFWEANATCQFEKDIPVEEDDLIIGVIWVRGQRLSETDMFDLEDAPEYYFAVKTPTDNWATEGDMSPNGVNFAEEGWQKVFFCGRVLNEESKSQSLQFQVFMGYGNQRIDLGGAIAFRFPWTADNEKIVWKLIP